MSKQKTRIIAVNNPGGQPRQYCVQFRNGQEKIWKRSAVFLDRDSANRCLLDLQCRGIESRVVHYHLPTAA